MDRNGLYMLLARRMAETADIAFDVTATADQLTYQFTANPLKAFVVDWGDGASDTVPSGSTTPSHTYAAPGTYRLRVVDCSGCFNNSRHIKPGANNVSGNAAYAAMVGMVHSWKNTGTYFWSYTFDQCVNMTGLAIPSDTTTISDYAFRNCSSWAPTTLPNSITSITGGAFMNCTNVAFTSLPSGLTSLSANTFRGCEHLQFTALPDGISSIGSSCFYLCKNLPLVDLPSSLTTLASTVFAACWRPSSNAGYDGQPHTLRFNSTPTSISTNIFNNDESLTDIYVPWTEGDVSGARWGATNATIHYAPEVLQGLTATCGLTEVNGHYTKIDSSSAAWQTLVSFGISVEECVEQDTAGSMLGKRYIYRDTDGICNAVVPSPYGLITSLNFGKASSADTQTTYASLADCVSAYASEAAAYSPDQMWAFNVTLTADT